MNVFIPETAPITRQGSRQSWQFHRETHSCRTGIHRFSGTGGERHRGDQTSAEPAKVAQADNTFAKEAEQPWTGVSLTAEPASCGRCFWRRANRQPWFQPVSGCSQQQVPIEVFLLASKLGNSEALW